MPALFIACGGCQTNAKTGEETMAEYRTVSGKQARELFKNGAAVIVDVRSKAEYDERHIKGAILLPLGEIETKVQSVLPDKNSAIILYCRSGRRSKSAANMLLTLGYKNVYDMGGIGNWPGEVGP
jgi:rhodanese-related sulfurtransferase